MIMGIALKVLQLETVGFSHRFCLYFALALSVWFDSVLRFRLALVWFGFSVDSHIFGWQFCNGIRSADAAFSGVIDSRGII